MTLIQSIVDQKALFKTWRQDFHRHPEIGFEEQKTSAFIADKLREFGFDEVHTGIGKTGIVGVLKGNRDGEAIGLRADMDALLIEEANQFEHRSQVAGKMHACGHDGHSASLLAAAWYLSQHRDFAGTVNFIFQPAEEGYGGGLAMLEDKLFERFPCKRIYAYHNMPGQTVGDVVFREGEFLAGATFFDIRIRAKGGHAAMPHLTVDPIVIVGSIVQAAQSIVSRNINTSHPAILSFTDLHSGLGAYNIIPDDAAIKGCLRFFDKEIGRLMRERLTKLSTDIASSYGAEAELEFRETFVPTINDAEACQIVKQVANKVVGANKVNDQAERVTGSEDFSFMLEHRPGCYFTVGNGVGDDHGISVHNPSYDYNDEIIPVAASMFVGLVHAELV